MRPLTLQLRLCAYAIHDLLSDVTDEASLIRAVDAAEKALGPIDFMMTVAGQALTGHLTDVTTADYKKSMDLNYFGTVHAVRAVVPRVRSRHVQVLTSEHAPWILTLSPQMIWCVCVCVCVCVRVCVCACVCAIW
jgi:NADP-dependent 3-hydroxy acid dehydrogenase YdfG